MFVNRAAARQTTCVISIRWSPRLRVSGTSCRSASAAFPTRYGWTSVSGSVKPKQFIAKLAVGLFPAPAPAITPVRRPT
jgi:hypothetical protein